MLKYNGVVYKIKTALQTNQLQDAGVFCVNALLRACVLSVKEDNMKRITAVLLAASVLVTIIAVSLMSTHAKSYKSSDMA